MPRLYLVLAACLTLFGASFCLPVAAQRASSTAPTEGLRENRPDVWVLEHAKLVTHPGRVLEDATIVIRGTSIQSVHATDSEPSTSPTDAPDLPPGAKRIDLSGRWVYPGLIDAWSEIDVSREPDDSDATYWNELVAPERATAVSADAAFDDSTADKLRRQGITARLVAPRGRIIKGTSSVVLVTDDDTGQRLLRNSVAAHLQLTVPRHGPRPSYPNSPMGATALLRQAMHDASWYQQAQQAYRADGALQRPEENLSLASLAQQIKEARWIVDAPNERFVQRAERIAKEFSLDTIIRGSGREYRLLQQVVDAQRPLLLPVDFPKPPNVADPIAEREVSLQELMHWRLAPENPARLDAAGATICLTTDGLDDLGDFLKQVRRAVQHGLPEDRALAAVTTHPAQLLNIEDRVGRVAPGMLANLLITDGPLWNDETRVGETWVAGKRYRNDREETTAESHRERYQGTWQLRIASASNWPDTLTLHLVPKGKSLAGSISTPTEPQDANEHESEPQQQSAEATDENKDDTDTKAKLEALTVQRDRIHATFETAALTSAAASDSAEQADDQDATSQEHTSANGVARLRLLWTIASVSDEEHPQGSVSIRWPDGSVATGTAHWTAEKETAKEGSQEDNDTSVATDEGEPTKDDTETEKETESTDEEEAEKDNNGDSDASVQRKPIPLRYPLGAFGREGIPEQHDAVLFRNATVWTCSDAGVIQQGDVLVQAGRITAVGKSIEPPPGCVVIDGTGKHLSPGIIDCHSHFATDGGVNESGQAVSAEVRVGDFIDSSDINIYRQLAGGVTSSNILHGSANPIGGQNQVVKLRWGGDDDELRLQQAPAGIKFALGENVKQSNRSRPTGRYPQTRMGVEQIVRDRFLAARQYDTEWKRWRDGQGKRLPPRRDLELDALLEVLKGERWIHCHSYRQDEIMALLDVLDAFHVRIGTLQHILEGYKVADRMADHGAMGSSFSDWWAYKFEVFDAIPYNGALMHNAGVVVSFNSDDRELARRLNTEAAKATKYGGVPEEEALKFVTLNPAKQLRIDQWVGSIEPGKDADLVLWSDRPLGTFARCEQTWIDGRKYFDRVQDEQQRKTDQQLRNQLIQEILRGDQPTRKDEEKKVEEEDRWERYDAFCRAHGVVHRNDEQAASQRGAQNE